MTMGMKTYQKNVRGLHIFFPESGRKGCLQKKALRSQTVIKDCPQALPKVLVVFGCRDCTCGFDNPLVTSCVSDAQNCGKIEILRVRVATLLSFRACRMLKTVVKWTFWPSPTDPFVSVCVADVENWCFCGGAVVLCLCFCLCMCVCDCCELCVLCDVRVLVVWGYGNAFGISGV